MGALAEIVLEQCLDCGVYAADVDDDGRCGDCRKSNPDYGLPTESPDRR